MAKSNHVDQDVLQNQPYLKNYHLCLPSRSIKSPENVLSPKTCPNAIKRKIAYSRTKEFINCSQNKINKHTDSSEDHRDVFKKHNDNHSKIPEAVDIPCQQYTYNYSNVKSSNNSCMKSTTVSSDLQNSEITTSNDENDTTSDQNTSMVLGTVHKAPRQTVTFQEKAVFTCPRPGCGGWREASLRHTRADASCQLFCRPASGMSEKFEIFLPRNCAMDDSHTDDGTVCSFISCQCPLVLSQNGEQTAAGTSSLEKVNMYNMHHKSTSDKCADSSRDRHVTTQDTGHIDIHHNTRSTYHNQEHLSIKTSICSKIAGHSNTSNNGLEGSHMSAGRRDLQEVLAVVKVEGDGRCLFRSISVCVAPLFQTARRDKYGKPIRQKYAEAETRSADQLRQLLVTFMEREAEVYQAMDTHVLNADQPKSRFSNFAARLAAMSKPGTYAGEIEINAVASVIRRPVLVLDAELHYINVYQADSYRDASACVLRFTRVADYVGHYDAVILDRDVTGSDLCRKPQMFKNDTGGSARPASPSRRKRSPARAPRLLAKAEHNFNRDPCKMGIGDNRTRTSVSRSSRQITAASRTPRKISAASRSSRQISSASRSSRKISAASQSPRKISAASRSSRKISAASRSTRQTSFASRSSRKISAASQSPRNISAASRSSRQPSAASRSSRKISAVSRSSRQTSAGSSSSRNISAASQSSRQTSAGSGSSRQISAASRSPSGTPAASLCQESAVSLCQESAHNRKCLFCKRKLARLHSRQAKCFFCEKLAHRACAMRNWTFWFTDQEGAMFVCQKCLDN